MARGLGFLVAVCLGWPLSGYSQRSEETCKTENVGGKDVALLQLSARNSKGALSLLQVEDMEQLEQYLAARATSGGQLTPTETLAIERMMGTLHNVTLPGINASRLKDLHELELLAGFVATCDATLVEARDGNEGFAIKRNRTDASRIVHATCRALESKIIEENKTRWSAFKSFHELLVVPTAAPLPAFGSPELDQFFEDNEYEEWLIEHRPQYFDHRDLSKNASAKVDQQATVCSNAQEVFERDFCVYSDSIRTIANQYKICRHNATDAFQEALKDVLASTEGRKASYAAVHKIFCYAEILRVPSGGQDDKFTECSSMVVDTDFLHITAPELVPGVELLPPKHIPGDREWALAEYAKPPLSDLVGPMKACHQTPPSVEVSTTTGTTTTSTEAISEVACSYDHDCSEAGLESEWYCPGLNKHCALRPGATSPQGTTVASATTSPTSSTTSSTTTASATTSKTTATSTLPDGMCYWDGDCAQPGAFCFTGHCAPPGSCTSYSDCSWMGQGYWCPHPGYGPCEDIFR